MALSTLASRPAAEEAKPAAPALGASIPLGKGVDIYPSAPMPEFNAAGGPTYAARLKGDVGADLVAVICNGGLPPRLDVLNGMRSIDHPSALRLAETGTITWPDGMSYTALAYHRPLAPRFMHTLDETYPALGEDAFNRLILHPMIGALADFMRTGVSHGAIRTTNIYWRHGSTAPPQLGECLSAPCGVGQPALFETIERGMTMPLGRGVCTHADDCYAFGIVAALFLLGHNPMGGMSDEAIVKMKLEQGTFNALIGHHRMSAAHIELLRGLLSDDPHQRWNAADVEQWLGGRRLTPKSSDIGRRASRHFDFAGKEYWNARTLARAFAENVPLAARAIEEGVLDKWMRRSLNDENRADDVDEAITSAKESGSSANFEEQIVARVCCALDPVAPIRYRGLAVMPGGIAAMLANAVITGAHTSVLVDIISSQLVTFWVEMHKHFKTELVPMAQMFERLTSAIEKNGYGNGVERAVYELNPAIPCLSPILRSQNVTSPRTLLTALEKIAASAARPPEPMDRHIAAFLIVRDRRSEGLLESLGAPENSPRRGLAMLTLYSEMQNRYGPENLPHLAQWLAPLLEPAIRRYFGKTVRDNIQRTIKDAVAHGDLAGMARLIDNPQRLRVDAQEFLAARLLYLTILKEINTLEGRLANREAVVQNVGKPLAVTLSGTLAMLMVMLAFARAIWTSL
jgi:hypothetical protein